MGLRSKIQSLSLFAFMATMLSLAYIFPHANLMDMQNAWMIVSIMTPIAIYATASKIEKSIQKLRIRMKKPSDREIFRTHLETMESKLSEGLAEVRQQIEIMRSEDAQMEKITDQIIQKGSNEYVTKNELKELATKTDVKELARQIHDLRRKIETKNKGENATQNSTPEENTHRFNGIVFWVLLNLWVFKAVVEFPLVVSANSKRSIHFLFSFVTPIF
jgi:predicted membrane-bound mannosyltransferase